MNSTANNMAIVKVIDEREVFGKSVKVYGTPDEPLFLAKEVADWIEHSNTTEMLRTVDDSEKLNSIIFSSGQNREMSFLTEDGLYEVLMQSRKPIAKQFKSKVKEILKDIRKHGLYATPETLENMILSPEFGIRLLQEIKSERERRIEAERQIELDKPKVIFADAVSSSETDILVGALAKIIKQNGFEIGEKRLFEYLRDTGYLCKEGNRHNQPTQKAMELGLFKIKETVISAGNKIRTVITPKITGKGQTYFVNKFVAAKRIIEAA